MYKNKHGETSANSITMSSSIANKAYIGTEDEVVVGAIMREEKYILLVSEEGDKQPHGEYLSQPIPEDIQVGDKVKVKLGPKGEVVIKKNVKTNEYTVFNVKTKELLSTPTKDIEQALRLASAYPASYPGIIKLTKGDKSYDVK